MIRHYARAAQPWVAWLFVACVVVQVFLAGLGVFKDASQFAAHRDFGYLFGWLVLILLLLAIAGRMGRQVIALSVLLVVLFFMQSVFVQLRTSQPVIAALHPVNGFFIGLIGIVLGREGRKMAVAEAAAAASMPASEPAAAEARP